MCTVIMLAWRLTLQGTTMNSTCFRKAKRVENALIIHEFCNCKLSIDSTRVFTIGTGI